MRTITLELLRHGPAHGQLLSPLTPYLALCENHAAVTLHMPFEHNQLLHRLRALGYKLSEESRVFHLTDTARVIGEILACIPGLTAESNKAPGDEEQLTHLRLIISASELALLPFELALAPNGLPGAGQHLLLQPEMPLCLTREIRRVPSEQLQWRKKPRVLFVAASPPGVEQVPVDGHLLALRRAVTPWVKYFDDEESRHSRVSEHLVFLPDASVEAVEELCSSGEFTHVHILAHGVEVSENYDLRYRLVMHDAADPGKAELVSGERLATALRASQRPDCRGLSSPVCVTLASCYGGNVGSVAGAGSSIAHLLHDAGIPVVIAGQFPLSFKGSIRLVECLYDGLLWGRDPRRLLYDLRRRLYAQFQTTHDWASLTAYVSLPPKFDAQLVAIQIEQAKRGIEAALNYADEATRKNISEEGRKKLLSPDTPQATKEEKRELLDQARQRIAFAKQELHKALERNPDEGASIYGSLASTEKRQAEIEYLAAPGEPNSRRARRHRENFLSLLREAASHYWEAFLLDRSNSWAVVQYLSLTLVMGRLWDTFQDTKPRREGAGQPQTKGDALSERPERKLDELWSLSWVTSLCDLYGKSREVTAWAYGNLIELCLLSLIMEQDDDRPGPEEATEQALEYADSLVEVAGRDSFEVYSTRRQIFRYTQWYAEISYMEPLKAAAEKVFERFPKEVEEKWR